MNEHQMLLANAQWLADEEWQKAQSLTWRIYCPDGLPANDLAEAEKKHMDALPQGRWIGESTTQWIARFKQ